MEFKIKDIVKNNMTHFSFFEPKMLTTRVVEGGKFVYPVNLVDLGGASIFAEIKAITMMRDIRKALAEGTFIRCKEWC